MDHFLCFDYVFYFSRNNLLSTIKELHESKEYFSVVDILKETLKPQSRTFIEVPSYPTLSRNYQYRYLLNSFVELKNYHVCIMYMYPVTYLRGVFWVSTLPKKFLTQGLN